jgi:hypothetical protein
MASEAARQAFISYSHLDRVVAVAVHAALEQRGLHVFRDETGIEAGEPLPRAIAAAIDRADLFIALVSAAYIASEPCRWELDQAISRRFGDEQFRVVALKLDESPIPSTLRASLYVELNAGREADAVDAVLRRRQPTPPLAPVAGAGDSAEPVPPAREVRAWRLRRPRARPLTSPVGLLVAVVAAAVIITGFLISQGENPDRDRDRDGAMETPYGPDCDGDDPRIRPGAQDVPENRVDEDCNGFDERFPVVMTDAYITSTRIGGAKTRVVALALRRVPPGATVEIRCSGKECLRRTRSDVRTETSEMSLMQDLRHAFGIETDKPVDLIAGTRVEISVTSPQMTGIRRLYLMRRNAPRRRTDLCLGRSGPRSC